MERLSPSHYFKLFKGEQVLRSDLNRECPYVIPAVESLIQAGKIVGQGMMGLDCEEDVVYWILNRELVSKSNSYISISKK